MAEGSGHAGVGVQDQERDGARHLPRPSGGQRVHVQDQGRQHRHAHDNH